MSRNKKNTIIFVSAIIILNIFVYNFFNSDSKNSLSLTSQSFSEKTDSYNIFVEYPQFSHLPKEFNKKIYDLVFQKINDFKKDSLENNKLGISSNDLKVSGGDTYFRIGWSPLQLNNQTISILIRISSYTGGAHSNHFVETFTYDVQNKKEITIGTLFGSVSGYLDRISQFTMNDLKNQMGKDANMDMIGEGTTPEPKNFSKFTLSSEKTVTFYFPEYQVAPYSSGEWKVVMPISYLINSTK